MGSESRPSVQSSEARDYVPYSGLVSGSPLFLSSDQLLFHEFRIASGMILSGPARIQSGSIGGYSVERNCHCCGKSLSGLIRADEVTVQGVSGLYQHFCWACAGYNLEDGAFTNHIRAALDLELRTPLTQVADYLEDLGRVPFATMLRSWLNWYQPKETVNA